MSDPTSIPTAPRALKKISRSDPNEQDSLHLIVPNMTRCASLPSTMHLASMPNGATRTPSRLSDDQRLTRHDSSSVKHLTCFWWKEKGSCRFSDTNCLYAHYDTGHYTDPPRQLVPGEPALAGRKLDKAMRNLANVHRSSGSLTSLAGAGSRHNSRSVTPVYDHRGSPFPSPVSQISDSELAHLRQDNQFLRNLVNQSVKEKAVLLATIDNLQTDVKAMKVEVDALRKAQEHLLVEKGDMAKKIQKMEEFNFTSRAMNPPFSATGRARVNTETRYLGGLLDNE